MTFINANDIKGSTTIQELVRGFPCGGAISLLSSLGWQCVYCAVSETEPLSLAAKRHGVSARRVIGCFRALHSGDLDEAMIFAARVKLDKRSDNWTNHTLAK